MAYFIVRLPADLETTYTLDLILSYIGEISFVEIISSTIAMFAAVWVIGLIRDRKKPLADHVGFSAIRGSSASALSLSLCS